MVKQKADDQVQLPRKEYASHHCKNCLLAVVNLSDSLGSCIIQTYFCFNR